MTIDPSKTYTATITTDDRAVQVSLDPKSAPKTVNNFVFLANKAYFDCVVFHRVIPGFVHQTGNPAQTNQGTQPGYTIPDELLPRQRTRRTSTRWVVGHGQHRSAKHRRQPVLHRVGTPGREPAPTSTRCSGKVTRAMNVVDDDRQARDPSRAPRPKLTQRMLTVTIHES